METATAMRRGPPQFPKAACRRTGYSTRDAVVATDSGDRVPARRAVAHHGNRNQCHGAPYARYQNRTSVRQELGTAVARSARMDDQDGRSPPFCAHHFLLGLSEPQPAQHAVGREHQRRAPGCREGSRSEEHRKCKNKTAVHRHFARTISYLVYQNLSRLSTQWDESINGALRGVEKEARRRLDELLGTVERLVE